MKKNEINQTFKDRDFVLNLLGKEVEFSFKYSYGQSVVSGFVSEVVIALNGEHSILVEDSDFYLLSEVIDFKVLDAK